MQASRKNMYTHVAKEFIREGVTTIIVDYDLTPQVTIPEQMEQIRRAVVWVYNNIDRYGGDRGCKHTDTQTRPFMRARERERERKK